MLEPRYRCTSRPATISNDMNTRLATNASIARSARLGRGSLGSESSAAGLDASALPPAPLVRVAAHARKAR